VDKLDALIDTLLADQPKPADAKRADAAIETLLATRGTTRTRLIDLAWKRFAETVAAFDGSARLDWGLRRIANLLVDLGDPRIDETMATLLDDPKLEYKLRYLITAALVGLRPATWMGFTGRTASTSALQHAAAQLADAKKYGESFTQLAVHAQLGLGDTRALKRWLAPNTLPRAAWLPLASAAASALSADELEQDEEWLPLLAPLLRGSPQVSVSLLAKIRTSARPRLAARTLIFPLAPDVFAQMLAMIQPADDAEVERMVRAAMVTLAPKLQKRIEASLALRTSPPGVVGGPASAPGAGSDGGPMLLIDAAMAPRWDASAKSYERVCDLAAQGKAAFAKIGGFNALVLSEPGYRVMSIDGGMLFIREGSDEEVWRFAIHTPRPGWKKVGGVFTSSGALLLMDSAEPGRQGKNRRPLKLAKGRYTVESLVIDDERAFVDVVRLMKVTDTLTSRRRPGLRRRA
jgi:hypothetical protein